MCCVVRISGEDSLVLVLVDDGLFSFLEAHICPVLVKSILEHVDTGDVDKFSRHLIPVLYYSHAEILESCCRVTSRLVKFHAVISQSYLVVSRLGNPVIFKSFLHR